MAFLNFMKKKEGLPSDIDLDIPPEPPKMIKGEISTEEPIDEELMPLRKYKPKLKVKGPKKEELPELPPLPDLEEELPPLPEEEERLEKLPELEEHGLPPFPEEELGEFGLPPLVEPVRKEKRGLFSFLKPKKAAEKLPEFEEELPEMPPLPEAGELPEIPPLPEEEGREFPGIPPLPEKEEVPMHRLEEEIAVPKRVEPLKPLVKERVPEKKFKEPVRRQRFVTINDFRQIQAGITDSRDVLKSIDGFFSKLEEVKCIEDKEYLELRNSLHDVQKKIMFVDKTLFKEGSV